MAKEIDYIKTNRVLSLSGGGIKGIAELAVLVEIEKRTGKSISELFTIISGTSVGGLVAALLTIPKEEGSKEPKYTAKEALEIFKEAASDIFPDVFLGSFKQLFTHKYSQEPLKKILDEHLGDNRMHTTTSRLIIPVNDLTAKGRAVKTFDSFSDYSPHVRVKDVLLATTAAPTYFEPVRDKNAVQGYEYKSGIPYAYADGGIDANRPAGEVLRLLKKDLKRTEVKEILDHTMVCAINFKSDDKPIDSIPTSYDGIIGWLLKGDLINKLIVNLEETSTAEVEADLSEEGEFVQIVVTIPKDAKHLDDASPENIKRLEKIGVESIESHDEIIDKLCDNLVSNLNKVAEANELSKEKPIEKYIDDLDEDEDLQILPDILSNCSVEAPENEVGLDGVDEIFE